MDPVFWSAIAFGVGILVFAGFVYVMVNLWFFFLMVCAILKIVKLLF